MTTAAPGDRNITIINQCNEVVRVGHTGASCNQADFINFIATGCPPGQTWDPMTDVCFWDIPSPEDGKSLDIHPGESINLILSTPDSNGVEAYGGLQAAVKANVHVKLRFVMTETPHETEKCITRGMLKTLKWSGGIWGATGCSEGQRTCETAICYDGNTSRNGYCQTFSGPVGPVTIAEFTLIYNAASDFYDVSIIGGMNLSIEIKPSTSDVLTPSQARQTGVAAYYWCGNPGGITAMNDNLSGCSWRFDPTNITGFGDQSIHLRLVAKSTDQLLLSTNAPNRICTEDSDCPEGEVCCTLQQLNDVSC